MGVIAVAAVSAVVAVAFTAIACDISTTLRLELTIYPLSIQYPSFSHLIFSFSIGLRFLDSIEFEMQVTQS